MSLYRKENNLRKAQARLDKVSKRSKQFQIRFQREQNSRGRFHTRAYIVRGEKEHHSGRGILHKAVGLKYRVKGDKPSVTRFINSQNPQTVKGHIAKKTAQVVNFAVHESNGRTRNSVVPTAIFGIPCFLRYTEYGCFVFIRKEFLS